MKTSKRIVKLLPVLAFLALVPFLLLNCDSGDEADGPTGPDSTYKPLVNPASPGLTAQTVGNPIQGGKFTVIAWYNNAQGAPVQGQEIYIQSESGDAPAAPYFTFDTNPTVTGANGGCSIGAHVSADTPPGSYTLVLWEGPKPDVKAYVGVQVAALTVGETIDQPNAPSGPTSVTVGATTDYTVDSMLRTSFGDEVEYQISWGDGTTSPWIGSTTVPIPWGWAHAWATDSTYDVKVIARCKTHPTVVSGWSEPLSVTVAP